MIQRATSSYFIKFDFEMLVDYTIKIHILAPVALHPVMSTRITGITV